MKKFHKKIMAIPLIAGSLFAATACQSDIKFNQDNLDAVMVEAQDYLEAQNNYSTEFARNYLIHLLNVGKEKARAIGNNYTIVQNTDQYDEYGNLVHSSISTIRTYKNENNTIIHFKHNDLIENDSIIGTDREDYVTIAFSQTSVERKYDIKFYDVDDKTYRERKQTYTANDELASSTLTEDEEDLLSFSKVSITDYYDGLAANLLDEKSLQITMDTIDKNKVAFYLSLYDEVSEQFESANYIFENDLLIQTTYPVGAADEDGIRLGIKLDFNYNTGDFEIPDVGSYTKVN